jgi:hypothetical protein
MLDAGFGKSKSVRLNRRGNAKSQNRNPKDIPHGEISKLAKLRQRLLARASLGGMESRLQPVRALTIRSL